MDDIQTWLYIIIGIIYFIVRSVRKKQPEKPSSPTVERDQSHRPENERRKPLTFDELLKEFTEGGRQEEEANKPLTEEVEEIEEETFSNREEEENFRGEGENRKFADEESKRIYEESIRKAEGHELEFEPNQKYQSKLQTIHRDEDGIVDASEIREMFDEPEDARKAVILSEILQRKY